VAEVVSDPKNEAYRRPCPVNVLSSDSASCRICQETEADCGLQRGWWIQNPRIGNPEVGDSVLSAAADRLADRPARAGAKRTL
jgi:hypothetical protein